MKGAFPYPGAARTKRIPTFCYCHTCERDIDSLGIMSHRAMHRRKKELCSISYASGKTIYHDYRDKNHVKE